MKRYLRAALKAKVEVDPINVLLVCLVVAAVLVAARVVNEKVQSVYDYAMDESEAYSPAL
jgi:hypothetical protein